jgi:hypothetical protein
MIVPENTLKTDTYIEKKIKAYFKAKLPQYVAGDDAWKINWHPNISFERPDDLYWLDFFFLPGTPYQQEIGNWGRNRWTGILQINICVPKNEMTVEDDVDSDEDDTFGTSAMDTCFNDIAKVFRRGVTFDGIRIHKTYRNTSAMQVYDDFCCLPVTIEWQADLNN